MREGASFGIMRAIFSQSLFFFLASPPPLFFLQQRHRHSMTTAQTAARLMAAKKAATSKRKYWYQARSCTGERMWFLSRLLRATNSRCQTARASGGVI